MLELDNALVGAGLGQTLVTADGLCIQGVAVEHRCGKRHFGEAEVGDDGAERQLPDGQPDNRRQRPHGVDQALAAESRLLARPVRIQMQWLGVHGQCREQDVIGFSDGSPRTVQVTRADLVLFEPQSALDDVVGDFGCVVVSHFYSPNPRAISMSCTSVVPSPISRILESR